MRSTMILALVLLGLGCDVGDSRPVFAPEAFKAPPCANDPADGYYRVPGGYRACETSDRSGETEIDDLAVNPADPCSGEDYHIACPGFPCAHGSCFSGECQGRTTDENSQEIDPGVCCVDADCDSPE